MTRSLISMHSSGCRDGRRKFFKSLTLCFLLLTVPLNNTFDSEQLFQELQIGDFTNSFTKRKINVFIC